MPRKIFLDTFIFFIVLFNAIYDANSANENGMIIFNKKMNRLVIGSSDEMPVNLANFDKFKFCSIRKNSNFR